MSGTKFGRLTVQLFYRTNILLSSLTQVKIPKLSEFCYIKVIL
jgi:hypothetical protein